MGLENDTCIRQEVCRIGKLLHERGYVAATDGNISVRLGQNLVLCTPTSMSKGMMQPEDMVVVDMNGDQKDFKRHPSTELGMHLFFYCIRPDIRAVVFTHPPHTPAFTPPRTHLQKPLSVTVS